MARWPFLAVVLLILLAACGSADEPVDTTSGAAATPSASPIAAGAPVVSDDGRLTFDPPDKNTEWTATVLDVGAEHPDVEGLVAGYRLGPAGTDFDEPLVVTLRLPDSAGDPLTPALGVILTDEGGTVAEAVPTAVERDQDDVVITFETTHFSDAWIWANGVAMALAEPDVTLPVGRGFDPEIVVDFDDGERQMLDPYSFGLFFDEEIDVDWEIDSGDSLIFGNETDVFFWCAQAGTSTWSVLVDTDPDAVTETAGSRDFKRVLAILAGENPLVVDIAPKWDLRLRGTATCVESDDDSHDSGGTGDDGETGSGQAECDLFYDASESPKDPSGIKLGGLLVEAGWAATPDTGDQLYEALGTVFEPLESPLCWEHLKELADTGEVSPELEAALNAIVGG